MLDKTLNTREDLPTPSFLPSKMSSLFKKIVHKITVTFPKTPVIITIKLNTAELRRTLSEIAYHLP